MKTGDDEYRIFILLFLDKRYTLKEIDSTRKCRYFFSEYKDYLLSISELNVISIIRYNATVNPENNEPRLLVHKLV